MTPGLAEALRTGTRALHVEVERSPFMRSLLRGQMERGAYCLLLRNLHALYAGLEAALHTWRTHPMLAALQPLPLARTATLAADLRVLHGDDWAEALPVLPAGTAYRRHVQVLERDNPQLLPAHAYVRYLGDLSGGQQLRRIVSRSLELPAGGAGVTFYDFGDDACVARLRGALRDWLATLPASAQEIAALVAEAQDAFVRHGALFAQLAAATATPDDTVTVLKRP